MQVLISISGLEQNETRNTIDSLPDNIYDHDSLAVRPISFCEQFFLHLCLPRPLTIPS